MSYRLVTVAYRAAGATEPTTSAFHTLVAAWVAVYAELAKPDTTRVEFVLTAPNGSVDTGYVD
jgi:hypothetical protein